MSELLETPQMDNPGHVRVMSPELCTFLEKYPRFHRRGKKEKEKIREEPGPLVRSPCWIWKLYVSKQDGYGYAHYDPENTTYYAHRLVYELIKGPIPKSQVLHHRCHNRACVNPEHLEAGTQRWNILLARDAGTLGVARGENSPGHKLTDNKAREIRGKYRQGVRGFGIRKLAKEYGVHRSSIRSAVRGDTWKHVLPEEQKPPGPPVEGKTENHSYLCFSSYFQSSSVTSPNLPEFLRSSLTLTVSLSSEGKAENH